MKVFFRQLTVVKIDASFSYIVCFGETFKFTAREDEVSPCLVPSQLPKSCYSTCHIECLQPVHGALNVDEKKLIAQFSGKLRDERFEPN